MAEGETVAGATALGEVNITPGSAVGRLGEDAAAAEAVAAAAKAEGDKKAADDAAALVSRDADAAKKAADDAAAEKKVADEKATKDAADALAAAEKAVADAKTPEEKAAAEKALADLKAGGKKEGAPEKYEAFKLPEGMKLDEAALAQFEPVARELNLSQEQAQKLVTLEAARAQSRAEDGVKAWNSLLESRLAEAKADKEIGGAAFNENVGHAKAFIKEYGTPALQKFLDTSDVASHVEVIRAFAKAGKAMADDKFVPGAKATAEAPKSQAERIFTSLAK